MKTKEIQELYQIKLHSMDTILHQISLMDTGYGNHFEEVYEKFGAIDLLMIEDGQ